MKRSFLLLALVACSAHHNLGFDTDAGTDETPDASDDAVLGTDPDATGTLLVTPNNQTLTVISGQTLPTLQFTAYAGDMPVSAQWQIDRGELATIAQGGLLTPKGSYGGKLNVTATYMNRTGSASVTILVQQTENGAKEGPGGVGGEGTGGSVSQQTINVLNGNPSADAGLSWLYPYDATVWPRGLLAPLLQWKPGATGNYDAVYIHVHEDYFDYKGYFAMPQNAAPPFVHHPIPQKAWDQMTISNAGEDLVVDLVFAKDGKAYGPITEKWKVAKGSMRGTLYYNAYGTNLAQSRAAVLAIKHGATQPNLITNSNKCYACHEVSADGSRLLVQEGNGGNDGLTINYDLKKNTQSALSPDDARYAWGALTPDGAHEFKHGSSYNNYGGGMGWPGGLVGAHDGPSVLYSLPSGNTVGSGIPSTLKGATPAFAGDGKQVVFNTFDGDHRSLAKLDYNPQNKTFSSFDMLFTPPGQNTAVWPSYLPTSDALVFQMETQYNGRDFAGTRSTCDGGGQCSNTGTRAELWWLDVKTKKAARLDKLNGKGYVPTGPNAHDDDATLNYEPTAAPVQSGGYAWVVFTSRRLYGNVATINPYWSDFRFHDLQSNTTPKKLWVAAIDLNAPPGSDPSHPAFYLPAQEILSANSRGFWVADPCKMDGATCETGDECCGGYCSEQNGKLVCAPTKLGCAQEYDKCTTDKDCCNGLACLSGKCGFKQPQ